MSIDLDYDDFDAAEDALCRGEWVQRHGGSISISDMTTRHLRNAIRVAKRAAVIAPCTSDAETMNRAAEAMEDELLSRRSAATEKPKRQPAPARGKKVAMVCHCGDEYQAREADLARGWGYSCSKSCAAKRRDFGRPRAKRKLAEVSDE